jgi:hypothetical protein
VCALMTVPSGCVNGFDSASVCSKGLEGPLYVPTCLMA